MKIDVMTKDKDIKTVVPALRFPEFRDGEGWHNVRLIDVTDKRIKWHFTGGPFGSNLKASDYTNSGIRVIQLQNIGDGYFVEDYKIYTSIEKSDELLGCNIYPGNIIMSKMGDPVGRACLIPDNEDRYLMCSDGIKLVIDEDKNDKYFIIKAINAEEFRRKIERSATGSTRKRISLDTLRDLTLLISNNKVEQKKIAECLGSLDDLISAVADKIETLKEYKKGLMQQLFPAEGKTIPAIRFPEFQNAREWKQIKLRDVGEPLMCKRILKEQTTNEAVGNIPFYKIGTFGGNPDAYISKDILEDYKRKYSYPNKGDILISAAGTIGRLVVFDGKPAYFQDSNIVWIGNSETKILNAFLYRVYQTLKWQTSDGGIVSRLYNSDLKNMTIIFPENKIEQQKIADCLLSVDELISTETAKLDQLKKHKKGLMQQLFPKLQ